jgi:hypothetical protein
MSDVEAPRLRLRGGSYGPHGWELDVDRGTPDPVTPDELAALQQQLRVDGDSAVADDLQRQTVQLAQVAEHWRLRRRIRAALTSDPDLPERVRVVGEHST